MPQNFQLAKGKSQRRDRVCSHVVNHSVLLLCQAVIMLLSAALEFHTRLVSDKGTSARFQDEILASIVQGVDLHRSVLTTVLTVASES